MPAGPPVAALQKHNVHLTVEELNDRVHHAVRAHEERFGVRPSPGLVLDLVRAPVTPDQYDRLFDLPRTRRQARSRAILRETGGGDFAVPLSRPEEGAHLAEQPDYYGALDPTEIAAATNFPSLPRDEQLRFLRSLEGRTLEDRRQLLEAAGRIPRAEGRTLVEMSSTGGAEVVAEFFFRSSLQAIGGLAIGPAVLAYTEGKAVKESVEERSLRPLGEAQVTLGKAVYRGVREDIEHPLDNAGYLALDILGFGSIVAGVGARAAAAAKAGTVAGAAKGLVKRPLPGTTTLRKGGVEVEALNSENAAVRFLQRQIRGHRQRKAALRHDGAEQIPADFLAFAEHPKATKWIAQHFSFERKIGRELSREDRLKLQLRDSVRKELDRVTGWATAVSTVQSKLPKKARRGLSRGEQMALFLESLDDATPARTLREAHEYWAFSGVGDVAAHSQKLRDIQMAQKVLASPEKQSPRFQRALALTRQAVDEMEQIKIRELGLDPRTAVARVAMPGEVARTYKALPEVSTIQREITKVENEIARTKTEDLGDLPDRLADLERRRDEAIAARDLTPQREGAQYTPIVSALHSKRSAKNLFRGVRIGPFGLPRKTVRDVVPELRHEFTGKALIAGDYRIDTTRLVGDALGRTIRGAHILDQYRRNLAAATKTQRTEFDRPIRKPDQEGIPDDLRAILQRTDEGELTAAEAGGLSKADWDEMIRILYPGRKNERTGEWTPDEGIEGVLWVDERLLDPMAMKAPTEFGRKLQPAQEVIRFPTLYLRPAYIINLLGSAKMAVVFEGMLAPPNIRRALFAKRIYGEKVATELGELAGAGRFSSYIDEGLSSRVSRAGAGFWNRITDYDMRVSALIYYMRRAGVKTPEQTAGLLDDARKGDETAFATLNEAVARAKKGMVEFDNLTWVEQNYLKHIIFVYPWQRGAAVWSLRTILERPVKSAVIAQIGRDTLEDMDDFLAKAPEWFRRAGYLPLKWDDDGNPTVVNPASLSTWSGLGAIMHGDPEDFGGPAVEFLIRGITGRDEFGNEYPDDNWLRWGYAALDVAAQLPQTRAVKRVNRQDEPLPPVDPSDRETLIRRRNAALAQTVLSPGWLWGYGSLISGGLFTPREANRLAMEARYYANASPEIRHEANKTLIMEGLKLQAGLLGRPVPGPVKQYVRLSFDRDFAVAQEERERGRDLTPLENTNVQIGFFASKGYLSDAEAAKLRKLAAGLPTAQQHETFRTELFKDYVDPKGTLRSWDTDVRRVAALTNPKVIQQRLDALSRDGLLNTSRTVGPLKRDDLREYGRKVLAYGKEYGRLQDQLDQISDPEDLDVAYAALREWAEKNDRPIHVGGRALPSPARIEWAARKPERKAQDKAENAMTPWEFLSSFDKEILGKTPPTGVAAGWKTLAGFVTDYKAQQPPGERRLPPGYENTLAKHVGKYIAGFYQDWLFSREPLVRRLQVLKLGQSADFASLLTAAATYTGYLKNPEYSKTAVRDSWADYVRSTVVPYIEAHPALRAEVDRYGPDLPFRLLD